MLRHHGDGREKGMGREQRINEDKCSADSNVNTSRRHCTPYLIELYIHSLTPAQSMQVFPALEWGWREERMWPHQLRHLESTVRRMQSIVFVRDTAMLETMPL